MAQLKYLDLEGLGTFWTKAKEYIDGVDTSLQSQITDITDGTTAVPVKIATAAAAGGVKSGGDITVAGDGAVTVNQAAKLKTAQTISLTGGATGSTTFDGSGAASIAVTVDPAQHLHTIAQVADLQTTLDSKAPLASPAFSGTPTAPTASAGTNTDQLATTAFVKAALDSAVGSTDSIRIKGAVNSGTPLPEADYKVGDAYIVGEAGTYAGDVCESGDWIIAIKDHEAEGAADSDWSKIQKNITSAVTFTGTPTTGQMVKFNAATGIVENASFSETQVSGAITASGTAVQTITVPAPTGDANPTAQKSGTGVTIQLPAYLLQSTYDTAMAGIDGTIKAYVDGAVTGATISGAGTINHSVGDSAAETVTIADNAITISLKNYALASAVEALETKVDANTGKLTDVTTTVGALIDSKISTAVGTSGAIATAIDSKLDAMFNKTSGAAVAGDASYIPTVAVTEEEISGLFAEADTIARVGTARVGTARVAKSN